MSGHSWRVRAAMSVFAVAVGVLSGCASTVEGIGSGTPSSGSGSISGSGSTSISGSVDSGSSSPPAGKCAAGVLYCDDFSDRTSGWPVEQKPHFYAGYDTYLGGTYHLGERHAASLSEDAPVKISSIAADYGIRVDVDAVAGPSMARNTSAGLTCWEHPGANGDTSAFVFEISGSEADLFLWKDSDGTVADIAKTTTTAFQFDGKVNHLSITCKAQGSGSSAAALLTMSVNGQTLIAKTYDMTSDAPWAVGDGVGLVAGGRGSDLFYDNFELRAA